MIVDKLKLFKDKSEHCTRIIIHTDTAALLIYTSTCTSRIKTTMVTLLMIGKQNKRLNGNNQ